MCVLQVCTGVYTPAPPWSCSAGFCVERSRTPRCFNRLAEPSAQLSEAISFFRRAIRTVTSAVDVPTLDALQILCKEDGPGLFSCTRVNKVRLCSNLVRYFGSRILVRSKENL